MSKPKLLEIFNEDSVGSAYSKLNNPVTVRRSGSSLIVSEGVKIQNNSVLTFKAPCSCQDITNIIINNVIYSFVDAIDKTVSDSGAFVSGALVSVLLDTKTNKAYIQNSASSKLWESLDELNDTLSEVSETANSAKELATNNKESIERLNTILEEVSETATAADKLSKTNKSSIQDLRSSLTGVSETATEAKEQSEDNKASIEQLYNIADDLIEKTRPCVLNGNWQMSKVINLSKYEGLYSDIPYQFNGKTLQTFNINAESGLSDNLVIYGLDPDSGYDVYLIYDGGWVEDCNYLVFDNVESDEAMYSFMMENGSIHESLLSKHESSIDNIEGHLYYHDEELYLLNEDFEEFKEYSGQMHFLHEESIYTLEHEVQPLERGGTGATNAKEARDNLDISSRLSALCIILNANNTKVESSVTVSGGATTTKVGTQYLVTLTGTLPSDLVVLNKYSTLKISGTITDVEFPTNTSSYGIVDITDNIVTIRGLTYKSDLRLVNASVKIVSSNFNL